MVTAFQEGGRQGVNRRSIHIHINLTGVFSGTGSAGQGNVLTLVKLEIRKTLLISSGIAVYYYSLSMFLITLCCLVEPSIRMWPDAMSLLERCT
jgi:hypothetical protein